MSAALVRVMAFRQEQERELRGADVLFRRVAAQPLEARIDAKLTDRGARVDRSKLGESCEVWLWLTLDNGIRLIEDFACSTAVFTWGNSD